MACAIDLAAANTCVQGDPAGCICFAQPFDEVFPLEVSGAYRTTMAFEIPGSDLFCSKANENVCQALEVSGNCCCNAEVKKYVGCAFTSDLGPLFGAPTCGYDNCGVGGDAEGGGGGGSMIIIIAAVAAVLILGCCGGFFCYRRRKARLALDGSENNGKDVRSEKSPYHALF
jgi:hypothetical protein